LLALLFFLFFVVVPVRAAAVFAAESLPGFHRAEVGHIGITLFGTPFAQIGVLKVV